MLWNDEKRRDELLQYYTQSLVLYYFSHFVVEMKIRELVKSFLIFFSAQFLIIIVAAAKTSYCKLLKVH